MSAKPKAIKIESAEYISGYKIHLIFSDGKEQTLDFGPFLESSCHPEIRKFLKPKIFKGFTLGNGDLMWGDYDLIFPVMDLYENKLNRPTPTITKPRFSSTGR